MTSSRFDHDTVQRRLRLATETLDNLRRFSGVSSDQLAGDPLLRAGIERMLQVIVDLAIDINAHIVSATCGEAPQTARESFLEMARSGIIDPELGQRLAPSAGLRNILVHNYIDINTEIVAKAVQTTLCDYPEYVQVVASYVASRNPNPNTQT